MYRDDLRDVKGWGLFLGVLSFRLPVTAVLLLLQTGAYILLRLWQAGVIPNWIDWGRVWEQSLLSVQAMRDGRYYTIFTCYLFNQDLAHLAFDTLFLGVFAALIESRLKSKWAAGIVLANMVLCSVTFLIVSRYFLMRFDELSSTTQSIITVFRPGGVSYMGTWKVCPLWVTLGIISLFVVNKSHLFWTAIALAAAMFLEASWISSRLGWNHAWDGYTASSVFGIAVGLLMRRYVVRYRF